VRAVRTLARTRDRRGWALESRILASGRGRGKFSRRRTSLVNTALALLPKTFDPIFC
jgi:hypothetical protein